MAKKTAATPTNPTDKVTYLITETAPSHVAGERVDGRKEIELTERQARAELLAGHIRPKAASSEA